VRISLVSFSVSFSVLGVYLILNGKGGFLVWALTIFFGLGAPFMLYMLVREKITGKPYLVITDKAVVMNSGAKSYEIPFYLSFSTLVFIY
jgi:hypothetical protein